MKSLENVSHLLACCAINCLVVGRLSAAPTTIDPDAFSDGTNIGNAFAGVSLSNPGKADPRVFSLTDPFASTGPNIFGTSHATIPQEWGDGFNGGMRADFDAGVGFVAIDLIGNDSSGDRGRLLAFDASNNLLDAYVSANIGEGAFETAFIVRPSFDIAYVIATGSADGFEAVSLDNLRFTPIPLPATGWIVSPLLMVFAIHRKRRA